MAPITFTQRKIVSQQTLAERLQAARRLRDFEVEDVAEKIGVRASYLRWIEEGRFDLLPAEVYVRGFLTRYARELNLPPEEILAMYDHEFGVDKNIRKARGQELPEVKPIQTKKTRFLLSPRSIRLGVALLVVVVLAGYLAVQFRALSAPPELRVENPPQDVTTTEKAFQISGMVEEGSRLLLNGSEVRVAADGVFSVEVPLEDGENSLRFVATSPVGKETVLERTIIRSPRE